MHRMNLLLAWKETAVGALTMVACGTRAMKED